MLIFRFSLMLRPPCHDAAAAAIADDTRLRYYRRFRRYFAIADDDDAPLRCFAMPATAPSQHMPCRALRLLSLRHIDDEASVIGR